MQSEAPFHPSALTRECGIVKCPSLDFRLVPVLCAVEKGFEQLFCCRVHQLCPGASPASTQQRCVTHCPHSWTGVSLSPRAGSPGTINTCAEPTPANETRLSRSDTDREGHFSQAHNVSVQCYCHGKNAQHFSRNKSGGISS